MSFNGTGCVHCNFKGRVPWPTLDGEDAAEWLSEKPCDACGGFSQFTRQSTAQVDSSPLDLDAIEARASRATAAPWAHDVCHGMSAVISGTHVGVIAGYRVDAHSFYDAEFIAHARADVPALVAHIRALHAAVRDLASADASVCTDDPTTGAAFVRRDAMRRLFALVPEASERPP